MSWGARILFDGSEPREACSPEELITWAEGIGPLAEWKIG